MNAHARPLELTPPSRVQVGTVAFWCLVLFALYGLWAIGRSFVPTIRAFPEVAVFNVVVMVVTGSIGLWLVRRLLRPVRAPAWPGVWLALVWGAFAACGIALTLNVALDPVIPWALGTEEGAAWSAALTAPLNEEAAKTLGVVLLAAVSSRLIRGTADGLVLGAVVGLGFQVMENLTYGLNKVVAVGGVDAVGATSQELVSRLLVAFGTHWTMSAVAGAGIGYMVARSGRPVARRVAVASAALLLAMAMHWFTDSPLLPGTGGSLLKVLLNFVVVMVVYAVVRRRFRARWAEVCDEEVAAGTITAEEARSLSRRRARRRFLRGFAKGPEREARRRLQQAQLDLVEERMPRGLGRSAALPWISEVERGRGSVVRAA